MGASIFKNQGIEVHHADCIELMASYPDNHFELCIVDPPYGIGMSGGNVGYKGNNDLPRKQWDESIPSDEYFSELKRVSVHQIIWGGNYYKILWPCRGYVVWDKGYGFQGRTYAESELAWTSFDLNARTFRYDPLANGDYRGKIHPTQKPVALYKWLLTNYAKPGDKILDTHLGSMSSVIACIDAGFHITGCELDEDYFNLGIERVKRHLQQQTFPFLGNPTLPSCGTTDKDIEGYQPDLLHLDSQTDEKEQCDELE